MYDVVVFEDHTVYNMIRNATFDQFLGACRRYILAGCEAVEVGTYFIAVSEQSGGDKHMMVVLMGPITDADRERARKTDFRKLSTE